METCPNIAPPRPPVEGRQLLRLAIEANTLRIRGAYSAYSAFSAQFIWCGSGCLLFRRPHPGLRSLSSLCSHISTGSSVGPSAASSVNRGRGYFLQQNCHLDRSEPGFPATRHPPTATCAASVRESRMNLANATNLERKSGVA
jgi:hypothetical protein